MPAARKALASSFFSRCYTFFSVRLWLVHPLCWSALTLRTICHEEDIFQRIIHFRQISAMLEQASDNSCYSNDGAAAMEIGGVTASEFHCKTKAMLRKMRLTQRDEIEYHRWSVIRWISHCVSWNKSFPAEGYRMQRISIRESCHVFSWWFCQLETIDKDVIYNQVDGIYWTISQLWNWKALIATRTVQCCNGSCLRCAMKDSQADRKILNSRVIDRNNVKMQRPENTRATYNAKRCINIDVFRSYLENTTLIALPITITFRKVPLSNQESTLG
jgi:hypothetical protein